MPIILIAGGARSGKSSVAYGLLARLREAGHSAAYCKPFSKTHEADADHIFAAEVLAGALGIAVGPAPLPLDGGMAEAASAISGLDWQNDSVIVEADAGSPGAELAAATGARVIEVRAYTPEQDWGVVADETAGHWGARLDLLVINAVPLYRRDVVSEGEAESWAEVDVLVIPESRIMIAPTVAQIAEHLDAVWTLEPVNGEDVVERYLIGGNIMDNGPTYYGRYNNQAVITRAQRPDIQLASMLPQTRCLVLTGLGEPTEYVKAEARERDIPLLQVFMPTIEAADTLDQLLEASTCHSLTKVRHYAAMLADQAGPGWLM